MKKYVHIVIDIVPYVRYNFKRVFSSNRCLQTVFYSSFFDKKGSIMLKLYDVKLSGNCYKIRALLSFMNLDHEMIHVDLVNRQQKSSEFIALNVFGQVPVLVDGTETIRDSQAILFYLASTYGDGEWLPKDAVGQAKVIQWLSVAANEIANSFAAARVYYLFNRIEIDVQRATVRAHALLTTLDQHLTTRQWLEFERPTIADVACYPYIAMASEGKISLEDYPHVTAWLDRFKQLPRYVDLP
jgi:glutathione S-transferase